MPDNNNNNQNNDTMRSPWDIAASSPGPATRSQHNHNNNNESSSSSTRIPSHYFCCSRRHIQKTLQLWICFDICLTIGLLSCLWLDEAAAPKRHHHHHHRSFDMVAGVVAALLTLRSVWSCCGFSTDWVCERSTLLWSARISWILIAVSAGGALVFLFGTVAPTAPPYDDGHHATQRIALQVWLWAIAVMELVRFFLLRHYYRFQVQRDRDDLRRSSFDSNNNREALRPWWWESHANISRQDLREPLIPDGLEWTRENPNHIHHTNNDTSFWTTRQTHPAGEQQTSWWDSVFFWRASGGDGQHDLRDEGSVDFVSVQDEWASRSEQDPYWWSRDEITIEGGRSQSQQDKKKSSALPTWIQTTTSTSTSSTSSSDPAKLQRHNSHSSNDD